MESVAAARVGGRDWLLQQVAATRQSVLAHPIYEQVSAPDRLARFMGSHVYASWDFMSLLKALQRQVTCVDTPWRPTPSPAARRLVNAAVLAEESDLVEGVPISHFELYIQAMQDAGADATPVRRFLKLLQGGHDVATALSAAGAPAGAQAFVLQTMAFVRTAKPHVLAAAFALGRADIVPEMFRRLRASVPDVPRLTLYLDRHLAQDDHRTGALALVDELCADDALAWREAAEAGVAALRARADLWSATSRLF